VVHEVYVSQGLDKGVEHVWHTYLTAGPLGPVDLEELAEGELG